jgi:ATP-dependent DNA helicase RecG
MNVTVLKGIGQQKSKILEKINIKTIEDLIHYYPRDYESTKEIVNINDVVLNETNIIEGIICKQPENVRIRNLILTKTKVKDDTGDINITWFKQPYLKNKFKLGDKVCLKGKAVVKYGTKQILSPQIIDGNDSILESNKELFPIYPLTKNISQKVMYKIINTSLEYTKGQLKEFLPLNIKKEYGLCDYNYAVWQIHNPDNEHTLIEAKKRLIYDEFLMFQLGLLLIKDQAIAIDNNYNFKSHTKCNKLLENLPFKLTNAQNKVWEEIKRDVTSSKTMNRLVQGDVGSGKTVIALLSLLFAVENGYQGVLMAPTEELAKQHYISLQEMLVNLDTQVGLLVGSMTKKQKEEMYTKILSGEINILVGTHAVIQEKVEFNNLAMVITDEQHRFGVKQRETLTNKGNYPHVLVMSATPIPRTLALIVYGDMDVSIIDELPPGRQNIKTYGVTSSYRERLYNFIEKEIESGRQCYIICPMVEENEEMDLESVISYTEKIREEFGSNIRISYLHGKMKGKEKNEIMGKFAEGEIDILVSTTVVEVGVNVPNATVMLIENAERFGLAQLHQLRGRVGRGKHQSYCVLISDSKNQLTKKRIKVLEDSTDGFIIAEYDLKLRGPGDAFGIKQHGLPEFRIGSIFDDINILKETNIVAKNILEQDPQLELEDNKYLVKKIKNYFLNNVKQISL